MRGKSRRGGEEFSVGSIELGEDCKETLEKNRRRDKGALYGIGDFSAKQSGEVLMRRSVIEVLNVFLFFLLGK